MDNGRFFLLLAVMMVTTYLIRAIPFVFFRKKIRSEKVKAFFDYIPYAVLSSMTFPAMLYATGNILPSLAGLVAALILSWREKSLLIVAIGTCAAAFVVNLLLLMTV